MKKLDVWKAVADAYGLLSAHDAAQIGLTARDLAELVAEGHLIRLDRGWYVLAPDPLILETESPWDRRRRIHDLRVRAAVRARGDAAIGSHHSGLIRHDLPVFGADLRQVHLTRTADKCSRRRQGLTVHQSVAGSTWTDGVIDPATAIVQTGTENGPMAALIAADAALHTGRLSSEDLLEACARVVGPRSAPVHRILQLADPRAESPGETRLRWTLSAMGFALTPQFRVADGAFVAVVDFLLEDCGLAIEFDGFVKYGRRSPLLLQPTPADVVVAEKVQEDHIRELGYGMLRVIWSDFDALTQLRRRIDAAVARLHRGPSEIRAVSSQREHVATCSS